VRAGLYKEVPSPADELLSRVQKNLKDAIEVLAADHDVLSAPVTSLVVTGQIPAGKSVVVFRGNAGQTLTLPRAQVQGQNVAALIFLLNTSANAVTVKPTAGDTLNGALTMSLPAGGVVSLSSDGVNKWLAPSTVVPTSGQVAVSNGTALVGDPDLTFAVDRLTVSRLTVTKDMAIGGEARFDVTGTQNDYNPVGAPGTLADVSIARLNSFGGTVTITGIAGGYPGRILCLKKVGTDTIVLPAASGGSAAANQFTEATTLIGNQAVILGYAGSVNQWIVLAKVLGGAGTNYHFQFALSAEFATAAQVGGTAVEYISASDSFSAGGIIAQKRMQMKQGANVASATTITLGDGNLFTIEGIVTAGWQAGSRVSLYLPNGIQVNHNSGAPGAGAVAILLRAAANLVTAKLYMLELIYNGTNWIQPD
jgi:hypothetical protein